MQGKILSPQLIIGDDGKHYEYDKNDVVNLGNKDLAVLTGSQVDFVSFDERVAKSIYIINENVNVSGILSAVSIISARAKALWGIGLLIFGFIIL
ncbi:MAG: 2-amino-4-hydroxy-6-hydroxymethyldihydropteridine pyrophosphokinase, partial [Campylobacter lanienae]|nr:2-amino-4-hydroxy-6-hydroxymethyldihydropteridine pyrophosphokinase [Campylobacteraceae bacterium]MDY2817304.1 2-amino-4-hydroxy-6-hydroxymethyldihydropteridine pyrophosphokinase [Campylobacter lanienae]